MKKYLILLILTAAFFRFFNFPELFHFTMDEEYWSYIPWNIATTYHIPLIGGSIAGTGLYTGPLFVYLMAIPAWFFQGNPLGFGYTVAFLGVLTSVLVFFLGRKMFTEKIALISSFLYASSFLVAIFDRHYWNASLTPFLSLLTIFFLFKKYYIPLGLVLALAFHSHGTGLVLILSSLAVLLVFRVSLKNKSLILGIILFFALQIPLVLFDIRHDLLITKAALSYSSKHQSVAVPTKIAEISNVYSSFAGRLVYFHPNNLDIEQTLCPFYQKAKPEMIVSILTILLIAVGGVLAFKESQKAGKISVIVILTTFAGLLFFREKISEYYFSPTIIPSFYLIALILRRLPASGIAVLLSIFLYFNLLNLVNAERQVSYSAKIDAVKETIAKVDSKPFTLNVQSTDPCQIYGYRYLYSFLGSEPVKSYMDTHFTWLYERKISNKSPEYEVILKPDDNEIIQVVNKLPKASY